VSAVAGHLAAEIGRERVLYDKFYEAEFAQPNLDTILQRLYHEESELVVVFLSSDYESKEWPGLEWRAIRDLIKKRQAPSIMLIRLDDAEISGVFSIDGYVSAKGRSPADLATLILERLRLSTTTEDASIQPGAPVAPGAKGGEEPAKKDKIPQPIREALDRGVNFFNEGHFNRAKAEFLQALKLAEDATHNLAIINAKEHLSLVLIEFEHDLDGAKALLRSCLAMLAVETDEEEKAEVLDRLARVHEHEGDLELSESLTRQSLAISERRNDAQAEAGTLVVLAWTVGRRGRTGEALDLNRKAYDLLMRVLHDLNLDDTRRTEFVYTVLGNLFFQRAKIHQRRAEPEEAETALEAALVWQRKIQPNHELAKLLRELAELRFFKRRWNEGIALLQEAATIYEERQMLSEVAECLHIMGRVHATIGDLNKSGEFLSAAASVALQGSRRQGAADALLSLTYLAMEQGQYDAARELVQKASEASEDGDFRAKCLMELSRIAAKQGNEAEEKNFVVQAIEVLRTELAKAKPEMERAEHYFTLGWYLREAGQLEEALSSVRKARECFETAGDAFKAAKASFEAAGLLDHMGRKAEAREMCRKVLNMIEGKPFFEIEAAVHFSLAMFAIHDDKDLTEADRLVKRALKLCNEHDLPLLPEVLLLKDELEHHKLSGTEVSASLVDVLDLIHQQISLCPVNKDGCLRFWVFSEARKIGSALHGTLGPNFAIVTDNVQEFLELSAMLKLYRDWSIIVSPTKYPENIPDTIPITGEMLVPANVPTLMFKRTKTRDKTVKPSDSEIGIKGGAEVRAEIAVSHLSMGATVARYFVISLEGSQDFGGAKLGFQGESLALPEVAHELLQRRPIEELKNNRLFFLYYNRGALDEDERLWHDLAIMRPFRCLPVYQGALPRSNKVRVVSSCSIVLPAMAEPCAEKHRHALRSVRRAILEVLASDESSAARKLSDLEAATEELACEVGDAPRIRVTAHVLGFEYDGARTTHTALVIS
jgi:tetratricopeptide (TPR) repeat protein